MVVCAGVHGFGGPGGPGGALQGVQVKLNTSQWWQFGRALQIVQKLDGWAALVVAARRRRAVVCNSVNSVNSMFDVDVGLDLSGGPEGARSTGFLEATFRPSPWQLPDRELRSQVDLARTCLEQGNIKIPNLWTCGQ